MVLVGLQLPQDCNPATITQCREAALQVPSVPPIRQVWSITQQQGLNDALSALIQTPLLNKSTYTLCPLNFWTNTSRRAKKSFFNWRWISTNWLFSLFQKWSRTWQECISMGTSPPLHSQDSSEQICHVFTPCCIPTFLPAWWWCWHWASKTTWTSLSFSPFSRVSCMWRPWSYQSSKNQKCSRSNPCPVLIRHFYFTKLCYVPFLLKMWHLGWIWFPILESDTGGSS